jgi:dynein heavy chain
MDYFTVKVKQNLHVVLAMSPTGGNLNERIRNFPALVNCCTVDWFTAWPEEALQAVAAKFMEETPFDEAIKASIV